MIRLMLAILVTMALVSLSSAQLTTMGIGPGGAGGSGPPPTGCPDGALVFSSACGTTQYMVIL
jgi:hypothetical protein